MQLYMVDALAFSLMYLSVCMVKSDHPPGHLQPLGSHRPATKVEERLSVPDPVEFFDKYIEPGKPVIFKGAANKFPNIKTWKDDNYLRSKFSNWYSSVDVGKYEGSIFGEQISVPFRHFLKNYKEKEYYIVQDIASKNPMRDDIFLLKSMACGRYAEQIVKVVLLLSDGNTECALHKDGIENIHCVLDGQKEWRMLEREAFGVFPLMPKNPIFADVDCRKIDMYKHPYVQDLPWHHAILETGDCLFVPSDWPHYVKSPPGHRSMALAVWFGPVHHPNLTDCPDDLSQLPDLVPVRDIYTSRLDYAKSMLYSAFPTKKELRMKNENFSKTIAKLSGNSTISDLLIEILDTDKNGFITLSEIENVNEDSHSILTSLIERPNSDYFELQEDWTIKIHECEY